MTAGVASALLDGVTEMRYENYVHTATVQRTKELFAEVNRMQSEAIKKILRAHGADAKLEELIDPIMGVSQKLLSKYAETAARRAEYAYSVEPVRRSFGKVPITTVKVRPHHNCFGKRTHNSRVLDVI